MEGKGNRSGRWLVVIQMSSEDDSCRLFHSSISQ